MQNPSRNPIENPLPVPELLDRAALQGYAPAIEMQHHFEEFVRFAPEEAKALTLPLGHPIPVRRRTAVTAQFVSTPCFRALARDLYEYAREHPDDQDAAVSDAAILLKAAGAAGGTATTFVL